MKSPRRNLAWALMVCCATRRNVLHGIVNGIDTDVWNPETDKDIAQNYTAKTLDKRIANKRALEQRLGLDEGDGILHGVVSRLTWQKGLDLLAEHLDWLVITGARLATCRHRRSRQLKQPSVTPPHATRAASASASNMMKP